MTLAVPSRHQVCHTALVAHHTAIISFALIIAERVG